jgi:hypothetical protein
MPWHPLCDHPSAPVPALAPPAQTRLFRSYRTFAYVFNGFSTVMHARQQGNENSIFACPRAGVDQKPLQFERMFPQ